MDPQNPNIFKITVLWSAWTPQIATRILRDMMQLQRLARSNRATFVVACDPQLAAKLPTIGVNVTENFAGPSLIRVYVEYGNVVPDDLWSRIPEDVEHDVVSLFGDAVVPNPDLVIDTDPYAGVKFYKDWHAIQETMPLDQKAPPSHGEPLMSPFL